MALALKCFRIYRFGKRNANNLRLNRVFSSVPKVSTISDLFSFERFGQIQVEGWITGIRKSKELLFVDITDGSCAKKLQIIIDKTKALKTIGYGASVKANGLLQLNKNGQMEVLVDDIDVIGECDLSAGFPFVQRMPFNPNHEREFLHFRPRTKSFSSLLRIRHKSSLIMNYILDEEGFFNTNVPVLTTNDCEGGGEVFTVKPDNKDLIKKMMKEHGNEKTEHEFFFDNKTYLTVSGQLHLEATARSLKKVYNFGPTFRAENSQSRLHLSEFYMLETEIAFINNINDVTNMCENLLKKFLDRILNTYSEEIQSFYKLTDINCDEQLGILNRIMNEKFVTLTYDEAFSILNNKNKNFKSIPRKGESFGKEHELFLIKYNNNVPVFVVEWPADIKPFYMKSVEGSSDKVEAFDLLCMNVGELCGGSVREDDYNKLKEKIEKLNFGSQLDWYLQLRRFGNVTTGGFGMGFERFLQLLLGVQNIKDTIPFPRWPHNCKL